MPTIDSARLEAKATRIFTAMGAPARRRGVDRRAARAREPARPRLPRRHPHPAVLGVGEAEGGGSASPVTVTAETPALARLDGGRRLRPGGGPARDGDGDRQGEGGRPQRGVHLAHQPRGPARRLRRDGRRRGARRHALGQLRARAQRGAVGRRRAAARHEPARGRHPRRGRSRDGARLRHQRGGRGQAAREAEPQAARAARLVRGQQGPARDRSRDLLRRSARRAAHRGRPQGLRAVARGGDPGRHPLRHRPRGPAAGRLRQRDADDLPRRGAVPAAARLPPAGGRALRLGEGGAARPGGDRDPDPGRAGGAARGGAPRERHAIEDQTWSQIETTAAELGVG